MSTVRRPSLHSGPNLDWMQRKCALGFIIIKNCVRLGAPVAIQWFYGKTVTNIRLVNQRNDHVDFVHTSSN